jgi:hypothetical protein
MEILAPETTTAFACSTSPRPHAAARRGVMAMLYPKPNKRTSIALELDNETAASAVVPSAPTMIVSIATVTISLT